MNDQMLNGNRATIFIVDDDPAVRDSISEIVRAENYDVGHFESAEHFLREFRPGSVGCLVLDVRMSGMDGITLYEKLVAHEIEIPAIVVTGHGDVPMSVRAMKNGVVDFLEKPCQPEKLITAIRYAIELDEAQRLRRRQRDVFESLKAKLTEDELSVIEQIVAGKTNKDIAAMLDISLRTVQFRRASIMKKLNVETRADLVELAHQGGWHSFATSDVSGVPAGSDTQDYRHLSVHGSQNGPNKSHTLQRAGQTPARSEHRPM